MTLFELFIIAISLSMDAFVVAACKGISIKQINIKEAIIIGLYFGTFQAGMPIVGYFIGSNFKGSIESIAHWIAFILLVLIGLKMIKDSRSSDIEKVNESKSQNIFILAIATSIDALVVGVTFALLDINITLPAIFIGVVTFVISFIGVKLGDILGNKFRSKAEFMGGLILTLMGTKILFSHLGFISF